MDKETEQILYLMQLEDFDKIRIGNFIKKQKLDSLTPLKNKLIFTKKIQVLLFLIGILKIFGVGIKKAALIALDLISGPDQILKKIIILLAVFKLRLNKKIRIIGITGSYGKTSTKEILYHLLSAKYKVIKTPENFNTPLGIAKTILTNNLNADYLIAEMGAYKIGDIKYMCDLYKPRYGILTAIGPQHLERFGNIENIAKAKSELFNSFKNEGIAVTDADNKYCLEIAKNPPELVSMFTLNTKFNHADKYRMIFVDKIKAGPTGTDFRVKDNNYYDFHTKLLGEHNVRNIMAAALIAKYLLIDWNTIIKRVAELNFIPHRLEIINGANNTTVLDDTYNANPDSVKEALKVLASFTAPRKIVVTPGMVELGVKQNEENETYGKEIAQTADYLLIVGNTNSTALKRGFLSSRSKSDDTPVNHTRVIECRDLSDATRKLSDIIIPGSVILFSNDLPDQYL